MTLCPTSSAEAARLTLVRRPIYRASGSTHACRPSLTVRTSPANRKRRTFEDQAPELVVRPSSTLGQRRSSQRIHRRTVQTPWPVRTLPAAPRPSAGAPGLVAAQPVSYHSYLSLYSDHTYLARNSKTGDRRSLLPDRIRLPHPLQVSPPEGRGVLRRQPSSDRCPGSIHAGLRHRRRDSAPVPDGEDHRHDLLPRGIRPKLTPPATGGFSPWRPL